MIENISLNSFKKLLIISLRYIFPEKTERLDKSKINFHDNIYKGKYLFQNLNRFNAVIKTVFCKSNLNNFIQKYQISYIFLEKIFIYNKSENKVLYKNKKYFFGIK